MTRRTVILAILGLLFGAGAYVATVVIPRLEPRAVVATGYMARVACACHFIGGRTLESCHADKEAGMEAVRLSVDPAKRQVTASVPIIASRTATHTPGLGCVLE